MNKIKFINLLRINGIETTTHYIPINRLKFYKKNIKLDNLDKIYNRLISLPIYPNLKKAEINYIINTLKKNF